MSQRISIPSIVCVTSKRATGSCDACRRTGVASVRLIGTRSTAMIVGVLLTCMAGQGQLGKSGPTYYRDVLRILRGHCEVCHRAGGIAPMSFETYEQASQYAEAIRFTTQNKSMPPGFAGAGIGRFSIDPSLSSWEQWTLAGCAACNAAQGDPMYA